jgi:RHS repeat-associated protein
MEVFPSNQALIDPTQLVTSSVNYSTAYSTQRKLVSYGGYYFLFFYSASGAQNQILYKTSVDQVTWTLSNWVASGPIGYNFDVYQSGSTIALAWLNYNSGAGGDGTTTLYFRTGTIFAGDISWTDQTTVATWTQPYSWPPSVAVGTDGTFWAAGIWQDASSKYNVWIYKPTDGTTFSLSTNYLTSNSGSSRNEALQLVPLPQGKLMALSSHYSDTSVRWKTWNPLSPTGPNWSSVQTFNLNLPANTNKWNIISAATTPDNLVHVVYEQYTTTYQMVWAYYNITSAQWTIGPSLYACTSQCLYPSLSSDALGNLYAFWMSLSSGVPTYMLYSTRFKGQSWSTPSQPFGSGSSITKAVWLSAVRTSSKEVLLTWTLNTTSPYPVYWGSLPLPSAVASGLPLRPWSKLGLSPYEQYFTQNGEYVSPGNGILTVSQTDVSVQGRNGLSLSISRVYSQPFTLVQGGPFNYETSPYANLGNGWQLNLPWVGSTYLHFLSGETFPLVWTSYNVTSNTWTLESHQTEDFVLTKTASGYTLTMKDGTVYSFNASGSLTTLADRTGQNQISFSYSGGNLASITDTVGRTATLKYDLGNHLANVTYGGQTVKYGYTGSNLVTVTDAVSRVTTFRYQAQSSWLLSGVVYTAGGNSTYSYGSATIGTDAVNYYVTLQTVYNPGQVVKSSSFSYNITDGEIANVSVKQSDGNTVQGYTNYLFNPQASSQTRTVLNSTLSQLLKDQFWFDPATGRSVQDDVYSGTSLARSFYNSRFYDLWGNVVYTRDNTGHESYSSFANTNSQYMFQSPGSLITTTSGKVFYDDFNGASLNTTAWVQGGSGTGKVTTVAASLLKLTTASSSQGTWQTNWVRSTSTFSYPFYAEVQTDSWYDPGTSTIAADLIISPQVTASNGNPFNNNDYLRLSLKDFPTYYVLDRVGGGTEHTLWSNTNTGTHSIAWKIVLTDRNTLKVYLNRGQSVGYQEVYSTTTLGLSTSFTPSYVYLSFGNLNTASYYATFDYVGLSSSNTVTVNGLQSLQKVELYDWNNVLQISGTVASGQTSVSLNATQMPFPYGYFKIYELDGRTVQFASPTREVWGGSTYSYTKPFRSGGNSRTSTGYLLSSTVYVEDALPSGATAYADGGDGWAWATSGLGPVASGTQSHLGFVASGTHEHYFNGSTTTITPASGSFLIQYVYIPSTSVPSEIMLQFHTVSGTWEHRAYWGTNSITSCGTTGATCGTNGTPSRLSMGALPSLQNSWVELIVKADDVGVNGLTINGWAYTLYNGGAYWDYSAMGSSSTGTLTVNNLLVGQKVEMYDSTGALKASATVASGQTSVTLNVYSASINAFPYKGYLKVYSTGGSLQYSSPLMTDIWGGDTYSYNQPIFSNSFNTGAVGTSIHNSLIGTAQYQNATSTPEEEYSNYDAAGNILQDLLRHNASPLATTYTYDSYGNKASDIGPTAEKAYYSYSNTYQHAYLTTMTQVLTSSVNVTTTYSYNFTTGQLILIIDPKGNETDLTYDPLSRMTSITHPAVGGVRSDMSFLFQDAGNSFGVENEKGNYTDFDYDGLNRVTQVKVYKAVLDASPIISQQNYTYNWRGQVKTLQDPTGNVTTNTYDYLGRLVRVVNPDGSSRPISYDDVNLVQSNYDENGHRTDDLYDALHRLTGVRQYYTTTNYYLSSYTYSGIGTLAKTVNADSQSTTYSYDDLNRLVLTLYPDGFNETRTYDNMGNLLSRKDPNGKTVNYSYDALNRLGNVTYSDGTRASYTYDKNGNLLSLSYLGNSATFGYDSRNRKTIETWSIGGNPYTLSYAYDQAGNIAAITYPDNTKVNFLIDPMNRATTVKSGSTTLATIAYRPDSRVANITYGNGVLSTYRYDNRGRPTEIKVVQGQTALLDLSYGYDNVGNVLSIGTESYSYDYLNRLTVGTGPWGTTKYGYDGLGNRLWLYQSPTNTTYTYGSYNRLSSAGSTSFTYDNNGNRITQVNGGTTTKYNYDFENRLTSVSQGSSTLGNYTYSAIGMRIQKAESGTTTTYVNSGVNVLYEKAGTTVNDYAISGGMTIGKLIGGSIYYFHQDAIGSTRLVTTGSTTSFSTNYQPFGAPYGASGTDPNYKYTGKPQDATGLYYYGARYYDTMVGKFVTRDPAGQRPIDPQTLTPYSYVKNNPETYVDPTGQYAIVGGLGGTHCWWNWWSLYCNALAGFIIRFDPSEQNTISDDLQYGTWPAIFIVAILAYVAGFGFGIIAAAVYAYYAQLWYNAEHYQAQNGYLYIYIAEIAFGGCGFSGCGANLSYWEIGAYTDRMYDWGGHYNYNLNHWTYKPILNSWANIFATWWVGSHDSQWPSGY